MANTTNFGWVKPEYADPADIQVLNSDLESIDNVVHQNRLMIGEPWVPEETYNEDDIVVYLGATYVCLEDNVSGAWDGTKWRPTDLGSEIVRRSGTGGASALADLDDVEITNPSTGQALLFDDDDDVWKNQNLPDVSVTKEASGNPIEITDGASAPLVKCVTEIQGSQDLHGYDKPWVGGAGKNKLNAQDTTISGGFIFGNVIIALSAGTHTLSFNSTISGGQYQITIKNSSDSNIAVETGSLQQGSNSITFTISETSAKCSLYSNNTSSATYSNLQIETGSTATAFEPYENICPITAYTEGEIEVRGKNLISDYTENRSINSSGNITSDNGACISNKIKVFPNTTYTLSYTKAITLLAIHCYDSNDTYLGYVLGQTTSPYTFLYSALKPNTKEVIIQWNQAQQGNILPTNGQLESGSTATPYEPFVAPTTHTTTYPSAIYRGSEDCVNGTESHDMPMIDLGDLTWIRTATSDGSKYRFYVDLSARIKKPSSNTDIANLICSNYGAVSANDTYGLIDGIGVNTNGMLLIYDSTKDTMSASDFESAMSGVKLAYELATPTTTPVTPTNLPIKSLSGYTHIESSTGEMEVEYISGNYQALVDLIQSSSHVYSTAEQVVGKWIDGNDLYEITLNGTFANSSTSRAWHEILSSAQVTALQINRMFLVGGYTVEPQSNEIYPLPMITGVSTAVCVGCILTDGAIKVVTEGITVGQVEYALTIRYTKSTQTRSLSAPLTSQKAQIEPLTTKDEEVPTEEENTVETTETEEENDER